ncbi:MAG: lysophospholipid acyltransferase family protein, partial [Lachnospiraceae bacterium]
LLSNWMRKLYCLFLDRNDIKAGFKTILTGIDYIKNGISIWIFPEGTRNKDSEASLLPFKEGSLKIAEKSGCPIIPVAMHHTADIFENHFPKIKKTHVTVEFGTPIVLKELEKEERKFAGAFLQKQIEDMLRKEQ